jgi:hypothetical protein
MKKRNWRIRGHKGSETFFDKLIPVGCLTEDQLKDLLRCLTAKAGLSFDEIVGAYVKRKTKLAHEFLEVQRAGPFQEFMCGTDPSFTAIIVDEVGNRVPRPLVP